MGLCSSVPVEEAEGEDEYDGKNDGAGTVVVDLEGLEEYLNTGHVGVEVWFPPAHTVVVVTHVVVVIAHDAVILILSAIAVACC